MLPLIMGAISALGQASAAGSAPPSGPTDITTDVSGGNLTIGGGDASSPGSIAPSAASGNATATSKADSGNIPKELLLYGGIAGVFLFIVWLVMRK